MSNRQSVLIDAHVHIYNCFNLSSFLNSAYKNFLEAQNSISETGQFVGVLLLTETAKHNWFEKIQAEAENPDSKNVNGDLCDDWTFRSTDEPCSIIASTSDNKQLIIIAGRQIVAAERLEVLALGTEKRFADGLPINDVIKSVYETGAIVVLPWGFGKWLGKRGAIIQKILEHEKNIPLYLGDNSGRLSLLPTPQHFKFARWKRIFILPGSDPLPFPSESSKPGSYGFILDGTINIQTPAAALKEMLSANMNDLMTYGKLESPYRFFKHQFTIQFNKFMNKYKKPVKAA